MRNWSATTKGILLLCCSGLFFTLMAAFVRLSGDLPVWQKVFFRTFVAAVIAGFVLWREKPSCRLQMKTKWTVVARTLVGTIGIFCNFYAVDHLILSDANMLSKLAPFAAIIFSALLLRETLHFYQVFLVLGALLGSLFVIKPEFENAALLPSLVGLLGGIMAGLAYVLVRKATSEGAPGVLVVFVFSLASTLATLPFMLWTYQAMDRWQIFCMLMIGCFAALGQFALTNAYRLAPAKEISIYDYAQVIYAMIIGFALFGTLPDFWSVIGYCIILVVAVSQFILNRRGSDRGAD